MVMARVWDLTMIMKTKNQKSLAQLGILKKNGDFLNNFLSGF